MIDSNTIVMMLDSLESTENKFKSTLDELIKLGITIANNSKDIHEDLKLYEDTIYHVYIYDIDYNIWIKKVEGFLTYNNSYYEANSEEINIIHIILTKKSLRKIITRKIQVADAYMKGLIKIRGSDEYMSGIIKIKNILKSFFINMNYLTEDID
jgi:hypothetical protein